MNNLSIDFHITYFFKFKFDIFFPCGKFVFPVKFRIESKLALEKISSFTNQGGLSCRSFNYNFDTIWKINNEKGPCFTLLSVLGKVVLSKFTLAKSSTYWILGLREIFNLLYRILKPCIHKIRANEICVIEGLGVLFFFEWFS